MYHVSSAIFKLLRCFVIIASRFLTIPYILHSCMCKSVTLMFNHCHDANTASLTCCLGWTSSNVRYLGEFQLSRRTYTSNLSNHWSIRRLFICVALQLGYTSRTLWTWRTVVAWQLEGTWYHSPRCSSISTTSTIEDITLYSIGPQTVWYIAGNVRRETCREFYTRWTLCRGLERWKGCKY